MFGDEKLAAIAFGKLSAGVERQPQRRHMRSQFLYGRRVIRAIFAFTKIGVEQIASVAVRVAEVKAGSGSLIEFVRRPIVAQPVATVVGKPRCV